MANLTVKGINGINLTQEQILAALAAQGIDISNVQISTPKASLGKLEGKLNENGEYVCACCGKTINYNELDETAQAKARKTGVCPDCQRVYDFVKDNKASGGVRVKNAVSAGELCRSAILAHADEIDEEKMALLTDLDNCKNNMKLRYPLFVEIPAGASKFDKETIRKPDGGKNARFATKEYTFSQLPGRVFFMTNDLYERQIAPVEKYMQVLFGEDEKVSLNKE